MKMMNCFAEWLTDEKCLGLSPAGPMSEILTSTNVRHATSTTLQQILCLLLLVAKHNYSLVG